MQENRIYLHRKFKDVVFVPSVVEEKRDYYLAKGRFFNLGFAGKPWTLTYAEDMEIKKRLFPTDWAELPQELVNTPRQEWWDSFRESLGWEPI